MSDPLPLINRKIKDNESYAEFFDRQLEECWPVANDDSKKVRKNR